MNLIGIYKITSPSGKVYIGQSVDINRRFGTYKSLRSSVKTSVKLYRSFLKYGVDKHTFEILDLCTKQDLNKYERFYQQVYNSISNGLNCVLTGCDGKPRENQPMTEKQKMQISKVHKGKVLSKETIDKIKTARANQIITKDHKENISKNSGSARIVLDTLTGVFYNSVLEASRYYPIKANTLVCNLSGKNKNKTNLIYA